VREAGLGAIHAWATHVSNDGCQIAKWSDWGNAGGRRVIETFLVWGCVLLAGILAVLPDDGGGAD